VLESPISAAALRVSTAASPYGSPLTDPLGSSILVASVHWLEGTLLGTTATTIAVICVASVGFMALTGRVDLRRAATGTNGEGGERNRTCPAAGLCRPMFRRSRGRHGARPGTTRMPGLLSRCAS
jgi:type IV secretory pathway VirB2 component (pilin)